LVDESFACSILRSNPRLFGQTFLENDLVSGYLGIAAMAEEMLLDRGHAEFVRGDL
jgi:hypothetical protein